MPDCGVTVEVVAVSGKRVRLGFAAPVGTRVHRTEVWNRIRQENGEGPEESDATGGEERPLAQTQLAEAAAGGMLGAIAAAGR